MEKRMYFLVPYNISPIQQAIQAAHAQNEYTLKHWKEKEFQDWAKKWKTLIILNGGTTNDGHMGAHSTTELGTLNQHLITLQDNKINVASFNEIDLNNALSAIAFICDERVFDREKYPNFKEFVYLKHKSQDKDSQFQSIVLRAFMDKSLLETFPKEYAQWVKTMGGEKNVFLREFISQFRLA